MSRKERTCSLRTSAFAPREQRTRELVERAADEATRPAPADHTGVQQNRMPSGRNAEPARAQRCAPPLPECAVAVAPTQRLRSYQHPSSAPGRALALVPFGCAAWRRALSCLQPASVACDAGTSHWQSDIDLWQKSTRCLNIAGRPIFLLIPADLETRLRLHYPELVSVQVDVTLPNIVSVNSSSEGQSSAGSREAATHGFRRMALHSGRAATCQG